MFKCFTCIHDSLLCINVGGASPTTGGQGTPAAASSSDCQKRPHQPSTDYESDKVENVKKPRNYSDRNHPQLTTQGHVEDRNFPGYSASGIHN